MPHSDEQLWRDLQGAIASIERVLTAQAVQLATINEKVAKFEENIDRFYRPEGAWGAMVKRVDDMEERMRHVESAVVRHAVYASLGSMLGATILATAVKVLLG